MTTICPHCQTPLSPSSTGETRCPSCGFMVLPQPGRKCPCCQKYTLSSSSTCQHCLAPLPPLSEEERSFSPPLHDRFKRFDKVRLVRLCIVLVFGALCLLGLRNFYQDKDAKMRYLSDQQAARNFADRYLQGEEDIQRLVFQPLQGYGGTSDLPVERLQELLLNLDNLALPTCRELRQQLQELSPGARKHLRDPQGVEADLDRQLHILQELSTSLRSLMKPSHEGVSEQSL